MSLDLLPTETPALPEVGSPLTHRSFARLSGNELGPRPTLGRPEPRADIHTLASADPLDFRRTDEIRPFAEEHAGAAADLYLSAARGQSRPAPEYLKQYFIEIYLRNPWISPDISSLVYLQNGKLKGFLGVVPRPMLYEGNPIRAAVISPFLTDRTQSSGGIGIKLLRQLFNGPQDLTFGDGSGNGSIAVFTAAGAKACQLYSFNWIRLLRPFQTAGVALDRLTAGSTVLKRAFRVAAAPLDSLLSKLPVPVFRHPTGQFTARPASPAGLLDCMGEARGREPLKPSYSPGEFHWLICQASRGSGQTGLRMMTVHDPGGARVGWFIYYAPPDRPATVLQVAALRKRYFPGVLQALFADAWSAGASMVKGQAIPQHLVTLTEQHCLFRQPYSSVFAHSRNPAIVSAIQSGDTAISRLDGSWWLRFPSEDWT